MPCPQYELLRRHCRSADLIFYVFAALATAFFVMPFYMVCHMLSAQHEQDSVALIKGATASGLIVIFLLVAFVFLNCLLMNLSAAAKIKSLANMCMECADPIGPQKLALITKELYDVAGIKTIIETFIKKGLKT